MNARQATLAAFVCALMMVVLTLFAGTAHAQVGAPGERHIAIALVAGA